MKKQVMMAMLTVAMLSTTVKAQYSDLYYHRVGDTIEWRSEIGYYAWWEFKTFYENNLIVNFDGVCSPIHHIVGRHGYFGALDSSVFLQYFYTPTPLKIVGLAGSCYKGYSGHEVFVDSLMTNNGSQEYFFLYDAVGDSFLLLAQTPWNPFDPHRTLHLKISYDGMDFGSVPSDSCCSPLIYERYAPIYEYYFDSAIYVNDSFYVGGSIYNYSYYANRFNAPVTLYKFVCTHHPIPCDPDVQLSSGCVGTSCQSVGGKMKFKYSTEYNPTPSPNDTAFASAPWQWVSVSTDCIHIPVVYPLIEVDTTVPPATACVPVANVQATVEGTTATVTWDGFPNYTSLRLRYGFAAHPQSVWTEVTLPEGTTMYTLSGLLPTMPYGVTLQAECEKKETEWSAPVTFYTGQDTSSGGQGTEGVEETMLSRLTFLAPNPARDEVTVTSSFSLSRIEIHDLQGVMVFSEPVSGHDVTLPLDFLRSGTYIVSIHTHNGTTHKRLAVAR